MDTKEQVDRKRNEMIAQVNQIINPAVAALNAMAEEKHNEGYTAWTRELSNLSYAIDKGHHDFVDNMIDEEAV